MLLSGRGPEQQSKGADTVLAFINLMLALGKVGKPTSGYGCLTGQGNGQGGREHGQKADQLPGYRLIENAERPRGHRPRLGRRPRGAARQGEERLRAARLARPGGRHPRAAGVRLERRRRLAQRAPHRRAARLAGAAGRLRRVRQRDRRRRARRPAGHPVGRGRGDDDQPRGAGASCGAAVRPPPARREDRPRDPRRAGRAARARVRASGSRRAKRCSTSCGRATAGAQRRLQRDHLREDRRRATASSGPAPPRTIRARRGCSPSASRHPDGRARFIAVRPPPRRPSCPTPTTRSTSPPAATRSTTTRAPRPAAWPPLRDVQPGAAAADSPAPRRAAGRRRRRQPPRREPPRRGEFSVAVSPDIRPDTLFAPFHWGGKSAANILTIPALDPTSRMPEFKVCAVRATLAPGPSTPVTRPRRGEPLERAQEDPGHHRQRDGDLPPARRAGRAKGARPLRHRSSTARSEAAPTTASCSARCWAARRPSRSSPSRAPGTRPTAFACTTAPSSSGSTPPPSSSRPPTARSTATTSPSSPPAVSRWCRRSTG